MFGQNPGSVEESSGL